MVQNSPHSHNSKYRHQLNNEHSRSPHPTRYTHTFSQHSQYLSVTRDCPTSTEIVPHVPVQWHVLNSTELNIVVASAANTASGYDPAAVCSCGTAANTVCSSSAECDKLSCDLDPEPDFGAAAICVYASG